VQEVSGKINGGHLSFPGPLQCLFTPKRFKVLWGGRGAGRSWGCARALLVIAREKPVRVLCVREYQNSIDDSVYKVLKDQIQALGWENFYDIQKTRIIGANGSEFNFEGVRNNVNRIKSYEGIDICWVEEAVKVSKNSWGVLIPTIRKDNSEIWMTFNPELESDYTYQRFVKDPSLSPVSARRFSNPLGGAVMLESESSFVCRMTYKDNPWFPRVLLDDMQRDKERDYDHYLNIWEGHCLQILEGVVYAKELRKAAEENRICTVPWDRTIPVDTYWDLGKRDATAIWFVQQVHMQIRVLDYYEATGEDIEHFMDILQNRKYLYGLHVLPFDAEHEKMGMRKTIKEQVAAFYPRKVRTARKIAPVDGRNMVRMLFPNMWFDDDKCEDGLNALRHYRYKVEEEATAGKRGQLSKEPIHDWASHAADALRYMAVTIRDPSFDRGEEQDLSSRIGRFVENKWRDLAPNLGWMAQ
jgi:phage terminase large subunit